MVAASAVRVLAAASARALGRYLRSDPVVVEHALGAIGGNLAPLELAQGRPSETSVAAEVPPALPAEASAQRFT